MRTRTKVRLAALAVTVLVGFAGVGVTEWAAHRAHEAAVKTATVSFEKVTHQLADGVKRRITTPRYGLGSFRSAIAVIDHVPTVPEFRKAIAAMKLSRDFPGVIGFGFIQPVKTEDLPQFDHQVGLEYAGGFPLSSRSDRPVHYIIRSVEPLSRNRAVLGDDVSQSLPRRLAIEAATQPNEIVLTAPLHLKQIDRQAWGALYIMPSYLYAPDTEGGYTSTGLLGWTYAAVDYSAALASLSQDEKLASYRLLDTTETQPVPLSSSAQSSYSEMALFTATLKFELGGREFTLETASLPAFEKSTLATELTWPIRTGGLLATILAALLAYEWVLRQFRAIELARKMTIDLDRLAAVGRLTNDAIAITNTHAIITWVNPAFVHLYGQREDQLIGTPLAQWVNLPDQSSTSDFLTHLIQSRSSHRGESSLHRSDAAVVLTEIEIQPYVGRLATTTGLVVIQSDITQRKRDEEALHDSLVFLDQTGTAAGVGGWQYDLLTGRISWSAHTRRLHGVSPEFQPDLDTALMFYPTAARATLEKTMAQSMATGEAWDLELPFIRQDGHPLWVRTRGVVEYEGGKPVRLTGAIQDITQNKEASIELAKSRELLKVTLASIGDGVVTTDAKGIVTWINPVAANMTGLSLEQVQGRPIPEVLPLINQDTREPVENPILVALRENRTVGLATNTILLGDQEIEWGIEDSAAPIRDADGAVIGGVMVFHDVTETRAIQRAVSERARQDDLTGLLNRHEFESRLDQYMATVDSPARQGAVFFIDLDHFKLVNDTGGHAAGDHLLCQVGQLIQSSVRETDSVARLGGDEFAVLLPGCSLPAAERLAQGICDTIDQYRLVTAAGPVFRVSASVGIAPAAMAWADGDEMIRAADEACRAAKEGGRNRFHRWVSTDAGIQHHAAATAWGVRVEEALDHDQFRLFAQRITPLKDNETGVHAEVLLRMMDGKQGWISPSLFIPAAERFHLATRIDRWVVQNVFNILSDPQYPLPPGSMISVNLSGQSVGDREFHQFVWRLVDQARFDPQMLCFEITETAAITNLASAVTFLEAMRKRGIKVALDDFGAGVASFGYLRSLGVDVLKIDGQYVRGMMSNPLDMVSIQSFCEVAKVLGVKTVAECVETQEQLIKVRELGVDYAQGHILHHPEPIHGFLVNSRRV